MAITGAAGSSPSSTPDLVGLSSTDVGTPTGGTPPPPGSSTGKGGSLQLYEQIVQQEAISLEELNFPNLQINGVLGGLPVAEKNQEYFAVFEEAGDTSPELIGKTQFKVTYLCDSQLNIDKPMDGGVSLSNINQNFERQKFARVRADQGTALNPQLVGSHPIIAVGTLAPVGGSQIGKGPLDYVTTMSFQLEDQLGLPAGLPVGEFYTFLNKTPGVRNSRLSYTSSVDVYYNIGVATLNTTSSNEDSPFRTYYDSIQTTTGSGVEAITDGTFFSVSDYYDGINTLTSSLDGNTRVRIRSSFGINIATSSVYDIVASFLNPPNQQTINYYVPITLNVYKSGSEATLLATGQKMINTYNPVLSGEDIYEDTIYGPGPNTNLELFADNNLNAIPGFSWTPNQVAYFDITTDYFDFNEGDKLYAELVLPEESPTGSNFPSALISQSAAEEFNFFYQSLSTHKNTAALRTYNYFGGHFIVENETLPGNLFINGVTGITASYTSSETGEPSLYNYTSSYWAGFNNTTSSKGKNISYLTSSTALYTFYGGPYYQANPGTETYNTHNLTTLPSSSLTFTIDGTSVKKSWINFGGNPMRLSFTPIPGDFIRFEYNPNKLFQITGVNSAHNTFKLKLDGHISSTTILDNFLIYRIIEDGQYIILDVEKDIEAGITQAFRGIIQPFYPSEAQEENQDELIYKLKIAGVIEDSAPITISGVN